MYYLNSNISYYDEPYDIKIINGNLYYIKDKQLNSFHLDSYSSTMIADNVSIAFDATDQYSYFTRTVQNKDTIYRVKKGTTREEKLYDFNDDIDYLSVIGNYIYFIDSDHNIWKYDIDQKTCSKVYNGISSSGGLNISALTRYTINDKIYFTESFITNSVSDNNKLYVYDTTKNTTDLLLSWIDEDYFIDEKGENIVCKNGNSETIYNYNIPTDSLTKLWVYKDSDISYCDIDFVYENFAYCTTKKGLYKINIETGENIYVEDNSSNDALFAYNGLMYYIADATLYSKTLYGVTVTVLETSHVDHDYSTQYKDNDNSTNGVKNEDVNTDTKSIPTVLYNNQIVSGTIKNYDNTLYISLDIFAGLIGGKINYNTDGKSVTYTKYVGNDYQSIWNFMINTNKVNVNGVDIDLNTSHIVDGKLYVPLMDICKYAGCIAKYITSNNTIYIYSTDYTGNMVYEKKSNENGDYPDINYYKNGAIWVNSSHINVLDSLTRMNIPEKYKTIDEFMAKLKPANYIESITYVSCKLLQNDMQSFKSSEKSSSYVESLSNSLTTESFNHMTTSILNNTTLKEAAKTALSGSFSFLYSFIIGVNDTLIKNDMAKMIEIYKNTNSTDYIKVIVKRPTVMIDPETGLLYELQFIDAGTGLLKPTKTIEIEALRNGITEIAQDNGGSLVFIEKNPFASPIGALGLWIPLDSSEKAKKEAIDAINKKEGK